MIKSELIQGFVRRYILHDYPAFKEAPLLPESADYTGPDRLDVPTFISSVLKVFDTFRLSNGWQTSSKEHESAKSHPEKVYANTITIDTLRGRPPWAAKREVSPPRDSPPPKNKKGAQTARGDKRPKAATATKDRLDQKIRNVNEDDVEHSVGIELCASLKPNQVVEHAKRPYPEQLNLDQYVIIHFTNRLSDQAQPDYFVKGVNKKGEEADVPSSMSCTMTLSPR